MYVQGEAPKLHPLYYYLGVQYGCCTLYIKHIGRYKSKKLLLEYKIHKLLYLVSIEHLVFCAWMTFVEKNQTPPCPDPQFILEPRPRPAFPEIWAPRSAPAPLFQNFWLPAPLPPRFTKKFGSPPRFPPGGAGSGGRERGLGRGGVDH